MKVLVAVLAAAAVAATACTPSPNTAGPTGSATPAPFPFQATPPSLTLAQAIGRASRLGPAGPDVQVALNLALKGRNRGELAAIEASGRTVTPAEFAARFGPDPTAVAAAIQYLSAAGLPATWATGSTLIEANGSAPAVDAVLSVDIQRYRLGGSTFYAALEAPALKGPLAGLVSGVTGLDDYGRTRGYAVRPGGLTPVDVLAFYNLKALRDRGLDGSGQTILFPEIEALPAGSVADLEKFATEFGLPPFGPLLTIKTDPSWGTPQKPAGEAVLDLEIAHEVAPKAKLVAYVSGPQFGFLDRAFDQLVTDKLGAIISESLGVCEPGTSGGHRDTYAGIEDRAVAQGMTHFVASGDNGAYTCGEDQDVAASFPASLPSVTAVGGTTVFESTQGTYFKEVAWGSPIDQSGGGGGPSQVYPIPDYQKPVEQAQGRGFRQVPDVAANADPITGYSTVFGGQDMQVGGTSAATPLWAATIALINQDLTNQKLRQVGFANPAIYWMGRNPSKLPAPPFHDVTVGNNLAYMAGPGWDFTTGWGSMDGAALDAGWVVYIKGGGA